MAQATQSVPSAPVSLKFAGALIATRTPDAEYDSATLAADPKKRTAFLRSAHDMILAGDKTLAACNLATRVAVNAPRNADLAEKMRAARAARDQRAAIIDALADMMLAVPSLCGHEYGKTVDGDSVNGSHLATVVWGALTKGAAKSHLKALA